LYTIEGSRSPKRVCSPPAALPTAVGGLWLAEGDSDASQISDAIEIGAAEAIVVFPQDVEALWGRSFTNDIARSALLGSLPNLLRRSPRV